MRVRSALIGMCLTLVVPGCARDPVPTVEQAAAALEKARATNVEHGPRAALPQFEEALQTARRAGDRHGEAIVLGNIGVCHKNLGDYDRAMRFHEQSLALKRALDDREQVGRTLSNIGQVRWLQGRYREALAAYDEAQGIFDALGSPYLRAAVTNGRSLVYDELGDYRRSRDGYQRALALYAEAGEAESDGASDARGNLGGVSLLLGRFDEAEEHYAASLALSEKLGDLQRQSLDLGNLGLCALGRGDFSLALSRFDRALSLIRGAGLTREEADWEKGRSRALLLMGRHDDARRSIDLALAHYERAGQRGALAEALLDLGTLELDLGELAGAETRFTRAQALSRELAFHQGRTASSLALGDVEWRRQQWSKAAARYHAAAQDARVVNDVATLASASTRAALAALREGKVQQADVALAEGEAAATRSGSRLLIADTQLARGERELVRPDDDRALAAFSDAERLAKATGAVDPLWRAAYGRGRVHEFANRPLEAIAAYRAAVEVIEGVRGQLDVQRLRAGYLEGKLQVYQALVRLLVEQGRAEEAFQYAERLRARAFRDLLLRGVLGTSAEGRRVEQHLASRVRHLQRALDDEARRAPGDERQVAVEVYSAELAEAERSYFTAMDRLVASQTPDVAAALRIAPPDIASLAARLPVNTALVEYLVVENGVAAFVVSRGGLSAMLLPERPADLAATVDLLRDLIGHPPGDQWRRPAARLRSALITPLDERGWLRGTKALVLVPHGVLHYVPFAVLPESDRPDAALAGDRWALATLPSAAAYSPSSPRATSGPALYAAAPSRTALPHAETEVRQIAPLFSGTRRVLVGAMATEASFKAEAGRYGTVHLATHGFFNKHNPLFSGLELEPDAANDGRLQVYEVLGLRLTAGLVTLSACDTGLGAGQVAETPAGEEFIGLTQAFLSAGSQAVLASLWAINDRSTADVMARFYRHARTLAPLEALAHAQRETRAAGGREAHPYYWAPFVLVSAARR
jgi:CHAT domain-containing protein/Tfp pilus assembly protein PilF